MTLLTVSGISVAEEGVPILYDISFTQQQGQKLVIAGETGSGKSTLLQTIAGLVQPSTGEVLYDNIKVEGPHDKLVPGHPEIAYLSQQFELPQFLRVEQVLKYSNTLSEEEAQTLYEVCRISHLTKRKTNQLSGGERQRIALARLLSSWPSLLLLDEPFSNLDMGHKSVLKSVIHDLSEELGISLILISHDPHDTLSWADEILVMQQGQLIQQGTPQHIYTQPVNEYTAALFGKYNLVPATIAKSLFGLYNKAKGHLLLRPESIKLTTGRGVVGKITSIKYFGSHYEIEVQLSGVSIKVTSAVCDAVVGDEVGVVIDAERIWWV
ncbi:ABC transporter ATP-binding protein [Pontibacter sp. KCTC 32443]|uniref:ABC transporter ATP-binding protein n=1 Tax=Pontibacter TaxID=323449 RepID=UPI00164E849B|nr:MULTISPECIES: ABC transporter ATP-binding protein [Pontibacter]MBC5773067.1 ABC transporter ATP-binding protein [Pontibacter sp. KCTC 32443]